jgi:hypothetical protein
LATARALRRALSWQTSNGDNCSSKTSVAALGMIRKSSFNSRNNSARRGEAEARMSGGKFTR